MEEIFKDIPGWEGEYQITNLGRVYNVKTKKFLKGRSNGAGSAGGYLRVNLPGKSDIYIHRLVAENFLTKPQNGKNIVNHKDENPQNNCADNLEWCTMSYNISYGTAIERRIHNQKKKIFIYTLDGAFVEKYDTVQDAIDSMNPEWKKCNIYSCLCGKAKSAYGYKWERKIPDEED